MKKNRNTVLLSRVLTPIVLMSLITFSPLSSSAEPTPSRKIETKRRMNEIYMLYSDLRTYLSSGDAFFNKANEERIQKLLDELGLQFTQLGHLKIERNEPGFQVTLKIMQEIFEDSSLQFRFGNKQFAKSRAEFATQQCISCHTRFEAAGEFMGYAEENLRSESPLEKADYFLATRQFGKAEKAYRAAFDETKSSYNQYLILTRLLTLYTRVKPDPERALSVIGELTSSSNDLKTYEGDEINAWLRALETWKSDASSSKTPPIEKANELIQRTNKDSSGDHTDAVELLRASALLHQSLLSKSNRRKEALYLLSLAYSKLAPIFYDGQQSESFAEQCIREFPGSTEAKAAFKIYRKMILTKFSRSDITHLPSKVQLRMNELKELAFEHPIQKDLSRL